MLPKAILLDMDDTIIAFDHGVDLHVCWKAACTNHLPDIDEQRIDALITSIRDKATWYWSDPVRHRIGRLDLDKARTEIIAAALESFKYRDQSAAERIAVDYGLARDRAIALYPGAIETLNYMRAAGIKLALITNGNSRAQRQKINRFELSPDFDCIVIEGEFGIGKPDHRVYLHVLAELGVMAEEAWMVGDNFEWEVIAPQMLGIKGIWINHKCVKLSSSEQTQPYKSISTLSDIIRILSPIVQ